MRNLLSSKVIALGLVSKGEKAMAEPTQLWTDYISLDPTYRDLHALNEKVRGHLPFSKINTKSGLGLVKPSW